jgi:hypothetical protein
MADAADAAGRRMSPAMEDSIGQLSAFVAATTPKQSAAPQPEYPGYDPVFKSHYPKFYASLQPGAKRGENYSYLGKDTPSLLGSLSQDCTRTGAPAYCYGVTRKDMVKMGWGTSDSKASTLHIFGA